jgi:hypothetical protein
LGKARGFLDGTREVSELAAKAKLDIHGTIEHYYEGRGA